MREDEKRDLQQKAAAALLNFGYLIKSYGILENGRYFVKINSEDFLEFSKKAFERKILFSENKDEDGNIYYEIREIQ